MKKNISTPPYKSGYSQKYNHKSAQNTIEIFKSENSYPSFSDEKLDDILG